MIQQLVNPSMLTMKERSLSGRVPEPRRRKTQSFRMLQQTRLLHRLLWQGFCKPRQLALELVVVEAIKHISSQGHIRRKLRILPRLTLVHRKLISPIRCLLWIFLLRKFKTSTVWNALTAMPCSPLVSAGIIAVSVVMCFVTRAAAIA